MGVGALKRMLAESGVDGAAITACVEKQDLVALVLEARTHPAEAEYDADSEAAQACKRQARERWRAAVLAESQRLRVEKLREQQARAVAAAASKRELCERIEAEFERDLRTLSYAALLAHFGCSSTKKLLVKYHPDRTPPGASTEEAVRREVIYKYVQQRNDLDGGRDDRGGGAGGTPSESEMERRRENARRQQQADQEAVASARREAAAASRRWREEAAAAAARERNRPPEGALFKVCSADGCGWNGAGTAPPDGPLGFYELHPDGELNKRPRYRRITPKCFSERATVENAAKADQVIWTGSYWEIGHRAEGRVTYVAYTVSLFPPAEGWEVVDSRAAQPRVEWV